jgi:hypothetical protein
MADRYSLDPRRRCEERNDEAIRLPSSRREGIASLRPQ